MTNVNNPNVPDLNLTSNLNLQKTFEKFFGNDNETNLYLNSNCLGYTDFTSLNTDFHKARLFNNPIFLSLNAQSLNSKIERIKLMVNDFNSKNKNVVLIAIQEIWQIHNEKTVQIPGFDFVYCSRKNARGGGWASTLEIRLNTKFSLHPS